MDNTYKTMYLFDHNEEAKDNYVSEKWNEAVLKIQDICCEAIATIDLCNHAYGVFNDLHNFLDGFLKEKDYVLFYSNISKRIIEDNMQSFSSFAFFKAEEIIDIFDGFNKNLNRAYYKEKKTWLEPDYVAK